MALTPGGGRSPTTQPPPASSNGPTRPPRDVRKPPPPTPQAAATSVVRWGVLVGGLIIITDLATRAFDQRVNNPDIQFWIDIFDWVINIVLFSFLGAIVLRETRMVYLGALAGMLAGLLDGLIVAATVSMAPMTGDAPPEDNILRNVAVGTLFAAVSALIYRLLLRWRGSPPR
ncbi:MAG: hypothetical protein JOZ81_25725 [Chloroflexi bacterium]|nr:hypothetical protein [Chloroflexota bacterium]